MTYRKLALPLILCLFAPVVIGAKGCSQTQQQTDTEILQAACIALDAGFTVAGETDNATQASKLCATVTTDIQTFVPGSPSQDAQQAGTDLLNFLSAISPTSKLDAEISVVVNAVVAILGDIPGATPPAASPAVRAHVALATAGAPAPRSVAAFKSQWNAALAAHPVPGLKPLK
jgi:hypothetical protein